MSDTKSPFYIITKFISPLMCNDLITNHQIINEDDGLYLLQPKVDLTSLITEKVNDIIHEVSSHYDINLLDLTPPALYKLHEGATNPPQSDSSKHMNGKWVQLFPRDISGYIALSDYNDESPFDSAFEVYGGKLEFPQHQFGFNPQRGTLILYPSGPHFIHQHTIIEYSELYYIQFFIKADIQYIYTPKNFPGDYTTWFKEMN